VNKANLVVAQNLLKELEGIQSLRSILKRGADYPVYVQAPYTKLGGMDIVTERVTLPTAPLLDALDTRKDAIEAELWHIGLTFDKAP